MFDQYWNSASLLRASLISAGIPEDVAELVTAKTRDNSEVMSTVFVAGLPSAAAGIVVAGVAYLFVGYLVGLGYISPNFAIFYVPQLAALTTIMGVQLWLAQVWDDLRYIMFVRIALNQGTLGVGMLCAPAIRSASGLHGGDYVRKVVSLPLQIPVRVFGGVTVAVLCFSLF
ncbi:hypothetical protein [Hyphomonas jannaschiana]|uniref:Uncharacterized protein n=1 Tax=Hyphomonas jannaschiana VP2 TaxID=1280952 RepID=A0A059FC15_9PROT|nr:hypothetical protein [Hyphomonas jannaschiana]KCZ88081.1 hypothetical protein HJA_10880 [Hyphomonas jannaschiana VP2]